MYSRYEDSIAGVFLIYGYIHNTEGCLFCRVPERGGLLYNILMKDGSVIHFRQTVEVAHENIRSSTYTVE